MRRILVDIARPGTVLSVECDVRRVTSRSADVSLEREDIIALDEALQSRLGEQRKPASSSCAFSLGLVWMRQPEVLKISAVPLCANGVWPRRGSIES